MPAKNKIILNKQETIREYADGSVEATTVETSTNIQRNAEPDYIKLYTQMWCEFNGIAPKWRQLFLQLVVRMSYADKSDLQHSQTVVVYGGVTKAICDACGWDNTSTLRKGLKALLRCGAIRRTFRATYQINPSYAGRGQWRYNPTLKSGGIEDLVATFKFKTGEVDTRIHWADNGEDSEINDLFRASLDVAPQDHAVLSTTRKQA